MIPPPAHTMIANLNPALNPEWMQFSWQQLRDGHSVAGNDPSGAQFGQMDPKRWATMYEQLVDLKVTGKPFDPTAAYTLQFLQAQSECVFHAVFSFLCNTCTAEFTRR